MDAQLPSANGTIQKTITAIDRDRREPMVNERADAITQGLGIVPRSVDGAADQAWEHLRWGLEARTGIEPVYTALQAAA